MNKKLILYIFILVSPFILIIGVNEYNRPKNLYEVEVFKIDVKAYNPGNFNNNICTWYCHSAGCSHKNSINKGKITPLIYKAIIEFNNPKNGVLYQRMNIINLVILWPVVIFILLIANIEIFLKRKKMKA